MSDPIASRASLRAMRRAGRRDYPPRGMHLADAGNLLGTAAPDPVQAVRLRRMYLLRVGAGALDQVVIASSHLALEKTGCWRPGARYLCRRGSGRRGVPRQRRQPAHRAVPATGPGRWLASHLHRPAGRPHAPVSSPFAAGRLRTTTSGPGQTH